MNERYDFDQIIERRGTDSIKWAQFDGDVLPLWVADMDFVSPRPVIRALQKRVEHGVFGYACEPADLRIAIRDRLLRLYQWQVEEEEFMFFPGVVTALNMVCRALGNAGDEVLIQPPIYPPFLSIPANARLCGTLAPLVMTSSGFEIDFEGLEQAITPRTRLFLFCNPHNPTGRIFTKTELERLAEICIRHDLVILSDEIHADFVFPGHRHVPIASLGNEVAERTVTFFAPSKTYNIPGLHCSVAHSSSRKLRDRLKSSGAGLLDLPVNLLGYVAALAAYQEGGIWLEQLLRYLEANRDLVTRSVLERFPGIAMFEPEGTYLAWLDCRQAGIGSDPAKFFLKEARVALSSGGSFGAQGEGFVRLNFGCPRPFLSQALERMGTALARVNRSD